MLLIVPRFFCFIPSAMWSHSLWNLYTWRK